MDIVEREMLKMDIKHNKQVLKAYLKADTREFNDAEQEAYSFLRTDSNVAHLGFIRGWLTARLVSNAFLKDAQIKTKTLGDLVNTQAEDKQADDATSDAKKEETSLNA